MKCRGFAGRCECPGSQTRRLGHRRDECWREEWSYYVGQYDKDHKIASPSTVTAPDHCSAFVATGKYTKDGKVVIAHNNWTGYMDGSRWTMAFDIQADRWLSLCNGRPARRDSQRRRFWNQRRGDCDYGNDHYRVFRLRTSMESLNSFVRAKRCSIRPRSMMWRKFLRTETTAVTPTTGSSLTRKE